MCITERGKNINKYIIYTLKPVKSNHPNPIVFDVFGLQTTRQLCPVGEEKSRELH